MTQTLYWIDAFAEQPFEGNPAVVAPLDDLPADAPWPDDALMQAMAQEHNQAETAFIRPTPDRDRWDLRWFTPTVEVPLCGHATLASGAVVLETLAPDLDHVTFATKSGPLIVTREGDHFGLDLPGKPPQPWTPPPGLVDALGVTPATGLEGEYAILVLADEDAVRDLDPAAGAAAAAHVGGRRAGMLTITAAAADGLDFVSRFFAPGGGIPEDAVTGSSFCDTAPYWAERLGKTTLHAFQASARGGRVCCRVTEPGRVTLIGGAVEYMRGELRL